jgi:hypothetical protein
VKGQVRAMQATVERSSGGSHPKTALSLGHQLSARTTLSSGRRE